MKISAKKLFSIFKQLEDKCPYLLGAKWDFALTIKDAIGRKVDCSGWVRWSGCKSSGGDVVIPDGSVVQQDWVKAQGWRKLEKYSDVQYAAEDDRRLFICFIKPLPGISGHVWWVYMGNTLESRGGKGVSSRTWNQLVFTARGAVAYEVPTVEYSK